MAAIWFEDVTMEMLHTLNQKDMISRLGLVYTAIEDAALEARFEVDERTQQPFGLLHGGVSCAVSESMGSIGANLCLDRSQFAAVGVDINATHLRGASRGTVYCRSEPIRIGRRSQVWQTELFDDNRRQLCVSRLTVAIVDRP